MTDRESRWQLVSAEFDFIVVRFKGIGQADLDRVSTRKKLLIILVIKTMSHPDTNIFGCKVGEFREQRLLGHSAREVLQYICDGHPGAADARLAAPLPRLDSDDLSIIHVLILAQFGARHSRTRELAGENLIA